MAYLDRIQIPWQELMIINDNSKIPVCHELQDVFEKYKKVADPYKFEMSYELELGGMRLTVSNNNIFQQCLLLDKDIQDARIFFGRDLVEESIHELVERLKKTAGEYLDFVMGPTPEAIERYKAIVAPFILHMSYHPKYKEVYLELSFAATGMRWVLQQDDIISFKGDLIECTLIQMIEKLKMEKKND